MLLTGQDPHVVFLHPALN